MLHLSIPDHLSDLPEIMTPDLTDWTADTNEQTITHVESGCRFHAHPVQAEGMLVPFGRHRIAVRFLGMTDKHPMPSHEEIMKLGTQGILWIVSYTMESPRPLRA